MIKMKDAIDERNRRERMTNSIIKWWNVNIVPVEEKKDEFAHLSAEEKETAQTILERLNAEAVADEEQKARELEEAFRRQEQEDVDAYNATTGSYSGKYGQNLVEDEEAMSQIEKILNEKEDTFLKNLEQTKQESQ